MPSYTGPSTNSASFPPSGPSNCPSPTGKSLSSGAKIREAGACGEGRRTLVQTLCWDLTDISVFITEAGGWKD